MLKLFMFAQNLSKSTQSSVTFLRRESKEKGNTYSCFALLMLCAVAGQIPRGLEEQSRREKMRGREQPRLIRAARPFF